VRVVAVLLAKQRCNVELFAGGVGICAKQFVAPGVVARAVEHHVVGRGKGPRRFGAALIFVRIGVGIGNDAQHMHFAAAELRREATPKILTGHNLQRAVGRICWRIRMRREQNHANDHDQHGGYPSKN